MIQRVGISSFTNDKNFTRAKICLLAETIQKYLLIYQGRVPRGESLPGSSGPAGVDCRAGVDCGGDASQHTEKVGREFSSVPVIIR